MNIKTKSFKVKVEESEESGSGYFVGYASVFGNVDSYGDVMVQGAFADTLKEWEGRKIPVFYGHDLTDPMNNIGYVESAEEDDTGLLVKCVVDTEGPGNGPVVYKLLKEGRIDRMSFGFYVNDADHKDGKTYIKSVSLLEVSVVPAPANPEAAINEVKSSKKDSGMTPEDIEKLIVEPIIKHIDEAFEKYVGDEEEQDKPADDQAKSILAEIKGLFA
nr:MAG TPA: prohead serine protease [Caudoviricetes sp.]